MANTAEIPISSFPGAGTIHSGVNSDVPVNTAESGKQVSIRIDELVVGRPLTKPIYDNNGVLLLAGGKVVTSDFKRLLRNYAIESVNVDEADANTVRVTEGTIRETSSLNFDCDLAKQLDSVVSSGLLGVVNTGPSLKAKQVSHGVKRYDAKVVEELTETCNETRASVSQMIRDATRGGVMSGSGVKHIAGQQIGNLTSDTDCLLSIALKTREMADISEHCLKLATLGAAIGMEMGFDAENCHKIYIAGMVHDWGMVRVPAALRDMSRILTHHEYYEVKKHPIYTAEMLSRTADIPSMVAVIAYQVHERPNGLGYPRGSSGDRIHLFARILGVADTYCALTSPRPHRPPLAPYAAIETLLKLAKSRDVDPDVVRTLLKVLGLFPIGSLVTLSNGSVGRVIRRNGDNYAKPIVQVIQDSSGKTITADAEGVVLDMSVADVSIVQTLPQPGSNELTDSERYLFLKRSAKAT